MMKFICVLHYLISKSKSYLRSNEDVIMLHVHQDITCMSGWYTVTGTVHQVPVNCIYTVMLTLEFNRVTKL